MDRDRFDALALTCLGPERIVRDAPLAPLTTFKVGGPADWLLEVRSVDELVEIAAAARACGVPITVLGGGSNVLIGDRGIRGAVLRLRLTSIERHASDAVRAEAGVTINGLVRWTLARGLAGLEAWAGTPGTVGGAIYGNAHFNGRNISELVSRAALLQPDRRIVIEPAGRLGFAYDSSRLKSTGEILLWAEFRVGDGDPERLRRVARGSLAHRKGTQPLASSSAGCIFQNPDPARDRMPPGVPASAGALIDRAGLKNASIGGARISATHANFFVNDGHATARDIRALVELARRTVRDRFGVELRDEIILLGEF